MINKKFLLDCLDYLHNSAHATIYAQLKEWSHAIYDAINEVEKLEAERDNLPKENKLLHQNLIIAINE